MTDRFDPKLYEEIKLFAIRQSEKADAFKQIVLRANDVENTAESFDALLDVVGDTKDAIEEHLGEGAFDVDEGPGEEGVEEPDEELDEDDLEEEEEGAAEEEDPVSAET